MIWFAPLCLVLSSLDYCKTLVHPFEKPVSMEPIQVTKVITELPSFEAQDEEEDPFVRYAALIQKYSEKRDLDPTLVAAILEVESNFGKNMKSHSGKDHGPMQINQWWFEKLGIQKKDVVSMEGAIKWGTKILEINREESVGTRGCWWSLYNSHNPKARRRYEVKVKGVFANLGLKPDCSGVKTGESGIRLSSATETSTSF